MFLATHPRYPSPYLLCVSQAGSLALPGMLSDVEVVKALDPYRGRYKRIHFKAPVRPAMARFEDAALQDEFDAVSKIELGGVW